MITKHSLVVLKRDVPEKGLHCGDVGAVVAVYADGRAYEVEFVEGGGSTVALLTLEAVDVRPLEAGELLHTRQRE